MGIVAKQSSWNLIFIVTGFAIGGITRVFLLPNLFTGTELGQLDILLTHSILLAVILNLGTTQTVVKFFEKYRQNGREGRLIFHVLLVPLTITLFFSGALFFFSDIYSNTVNVSSRSFIVDSTPIMILIVVSQVLFQVLVGISNSYLKSTLPTFFAEVFVRFLVLVGLILFSFNILDYESFLVFYAVVYISQMLSLFIATKGVMKITPSGLLKSERIELLSYSLYSVLDNGAARFISLLDMLMIGKFLEARYTGYYAIGMFISTVIKIPARAINPIAMSVVAKSWTEKDLDNIKDVYTKSSLNQMVIGGILLVMIWASVDELQLLLPLEFRGISNVIFWLGLGNFINLMSGVNSSIILTSSNYRMNFLMNLFLLVITITSNVIFIPIYGISGAAFATFLSLLLFNLAKFIYVKMKWGMQPFTLRHIPAFLIITVLFCLASIVPSIDVHPLLSAGIIAIAFGLVASVIFYITKISDDLTNLADKILIRFNLK